MKLNDLHRTSASLKQLLLYFDPNNSLGKDYNPGKVWKILNIIKLFKNFIFASVLITF